MIQHLIYWWRRSRHPELADYLSEGLGIRCRERRSRRYWKNHLALSKRFQSEAVRILHPDARRFTILGAGRLLDLDAETVLRRGARITLVDADPGAVASWRPFIRSARRAGAAVDSLHCELTGRILGWTNELKGRLCSASAPTAESLTAELWRLPTLPRRQVLLPESDAIFSLNLLGQIPIHWRERVLGIMRDLAPSLLDGEGNPPQIIEAAIERTMSLLQIEHLELLRAARARLTILISDTEFYFYRRDVAPWQVDKALYDCPIEGFLPGILKMKDSWLWHLAPQGIEQQEYGAIHKIGAFATVLE